MHERANDKKTAAHRTCTAEQALLIGLLQQRNVKSLGALLALTQDELDLLAIRQ
jgi:hypothetical protein